MFSKLGSSQVKENNMSREKLVGKTPTVFNGFTSEVISMNLSGLLGEILTIVDASISGDQNKAIKDLIKQSVSRKQDFFFDNGVLYPNGSKIAPEFLVPYVVQEKTLLPIGIQERVITEVRSYPESNY